MPRAGACCAEPLPGDRHEAGKNKKALKTQAVASDIVKEVSEFKISSKDSKSFCKLKLFERTEKSILFQIKSFYVNPLMLIYDLDIA